MCLLVQDIVIRLYLTTFIKTLLIFMLITLNLFIIAAFYYRCHSSHSVPVSKAQWLSSLKHDAHSHHVPQ